MKRKQLIGIHLVFWFIVILMTYSSIIFDYKEISRNRILTSCFKLFLEALDFYISYSLIHTYIFIKRKKLTPFIIITLIYGFCYTLFYAYGSNYLQIILGMAKGFQNIKSYFFFSFYYSILYLILGGLFKLAIEGYKNNQQTLLLEKQNVKSELALLRSQVNPHFLFNVLNTIHSYLNSNKGIAAESIIKLSDMMRYMLHEATKESITLQKEIEYLESYITLQTLRFDKPNFVRFNKKGNMTNVMIPPMLFTPYLENAFKHGKMHSPSPGITIDLTFDCNVLEFKIANYINSVKSGLFDDKGGVGLKNVDRRLKLLYPRKHKLEIKEENNIFSVLLQIEI